MEEKTVKDYLAVYRSEFALLKKRAKLNNQIDENVAASKQSARDNFKAQAICFYDASLRFAQEGVTPEFGENSTIRNFVE